MKTTATRTFKVTIDADTLSPVNINSIERWENEGGAAVPEDLDPTLPLRKGEIFEVVDIAPKTLDGKRYYLVQIELLALPE